MKYSGISVFDLFSIGIGPSSSHTVGPMRAAHRFLLDCHCSSSASSVSIVTLKVHLYGSLALTGRGHGTDTAILLGLSGYLPESIDPVEVPVILEKIQREQQLLLFEDHKVSFSPEDDLCFHVQEILPQHSNGMRFVAYDAHQNVCLEQIYFSVGGGFILSEAEIEAELTVDVDAKDDIQAQIKAKLPFPFDSGKALLAHGEVSGLSIAEMVLENEKVWRSETEIQKKLLQIWTVMDHSIMAGCQNTGILPGGLKLRRRASALFDRLTSSEETDALDWLNVYAIAVNEENAAGGRIVTSPTNGAAGIIPAVLKYHMTFNKKATEKDIQTFFLTAAAIGILYKEGASISAAEVGCQGEVGVASSMAAAALCAVLGGTMAQVENAAEIAMEHHLGLTCDPIGGLVQIPCIERNTMGAVQAVNASKLALWGDGHHYVSLDQVIATMRETGLDMQSKYKETSQGGLATAVYLPEC